MFNKKNSEEDKKVEKLVNQIQAISEIVDKIQQDVDAIKLTSHIDKNYDVPSTSKQSDIMNNKPKSDVLKSQNRSRRHRSIDTTKINADEFNDNNKQEKINLATQTSNSNEVINVPYFVCFVKTRSVQTEDDEAKIQEKNKNGKVKTNSKKEILPQQTQKDAKVEANLKAKSPCKGCLNSKSSKSTNDKKKSPVKKSGMCSKSCAYLIDNSVVSDKNQMRNTKKSVKNVKEEKHNSKIHDYDNMKNETKIKHFKNKKVMVDLMENNKNHVSETFHTDNQVLFNCKFLENIDFTHVNNSKNKKQKNRSNLIGSNIEKSKMKKNDCKHCGGAKNILKINQAILMQDPPMFLVSPKLLKKD